MALSHDTWTPLLSLPSVQTSWPQAKYFCIQAYNSVNKHIYHMRHKAPSIQLLKNIGQKSWLPVISYSHLFHTQWICNKLGLIILCQFCHAFHVKSVESIVRNNWIHSRTLIASYSLDSFLSSLNVGKGKKQPSASVWSNINWVQTVWISTWIDWVQNFCGYDMTGNQNPLYGVHPWWYEQDGKKQQETLECGLKEEKEEKKEPYPHDNY